jgi:hypothetical protein
VTADPATWPDRPPVRYDDPRIIGWATGYDPAGTQAGPVAIFEPSYGTTRFEPGKALGPSDVRLEGDDPNTYSVFSLGDGGYITLTFSVPVRNGPGPDIAVFENSFGDNFLELAFVEVSSDGSSFVRFPSISLTPTAGIREDLEKDDFTTLNPDNLYNLAGKYPGGYGTPFDLAELSGTAGLDINNIVAIRVRDVVGSVDDRWARRDSLGNKIKDPFPTVFESGGFDLDAVAILYQVPEPTSAALLIGGACTLLVRRRRR